MTVLGIKLNKIILFLLAFNTVFMDKAQASLSEDEITDLSRRYIHFQPREFPDVRDKPCKAIQFVYFLQHELQSAEQSNNSKHSQKLAREIVAIITEGTGVGGISTQRSATEEEKKIIFGALYQAYSKGAEYINVQNPTGHQRVIQTVYEVGKNSQGSLPKTYNFISDTSAYEKFMKEFQWVYLQLENEPDWRVYGDKFWQILKSPKEKLEFKEFFLKNPQEIDLLRQADRFLSKKGTWTYAIDPASVLRYLKKVAPEERDQFVDKVLKIIANIPEDLEGCRTAFRALIDLDRKEREEFVKHFLILITQAPGLNSKQCAKILDSLYYVEKEEREKFIEYVLKIFPDTALELFQSREESIREILRKGYQSAIEDLSEYSDSEQRQNRINQVLRFAEENKLPDDEIVMFWNQTYLRR